ncbi:MAG: hypothetical protein J6Q36_04940 [Alistipes sp.]|nr:hypothetical protein [Alistipes sp.]
MRKIFTSLKSVVSAVIIAAMAFSVSCSYDDTAINDRVDQVENDLKALTERVDALEKKLGAEVESLKALIDGKVVIVDVTTDEAGNTTIKLSNGKTITVLAAEDTLQYRVDDGVLEVSADGENWVAVEVAPEQVVADVVLNEDGTVTVKLANGEEFTVVKAELIECEAASNGVYVLPGESKEIALSINDAVVDINVMNQPLGWSASIEEATEAPEDEGGAIAPMPLAAGGKNYVVKINAPAASFKEAAKSGVVSVHFNTAAGACKVLSVNVNVAELTLSIDKDVITLTNSVVSTTSHPMMGTRTDFVDFYIGVVSKADWDEYGYESYTNWTMRTSGFSNVLQPLTEYVAGVTEVESYTFAAEQLQDMLWGLEFELGQSYYIFVTPDYDPQTYEPDLKKAVMVEYKNVLIKAVIDQESITPSDFAATYSLAGYDVFLIGCASMKEYEEMLSYGQFSDLGGYFEYILTDPMMGGLNLQAGAVIPSVIDTKLGLADLNAASMTGRIELAADTEYHLFVFPFNMNDVYNPSFKATADAIYDLGSFTTKPYTKGSFDPGAVFTLNNHDDESINVEVTFNENVVKATYKWFDAAALEQDARVEAVFEQMIYTFNEYTTSLEAYAGSYSFENGFPNPLYLGVIAINAAGEYVYVEKEFLYVEPEPIALTSFEYKGRHLDIDDNPETSGGDHVYIAKAVDGTELTIGLYYTYADENGVITPGEYEYCANYFNAMYSFWNGFVIVGDESYSGSKMVVTEDTVKLKLKGASTNVYLFDKNATPVVPEEPETTVASAKASLVTDTTFGGFNPYDVTFSFENGDQVLVRFNTSGNQYLHLGNWQTDSWQEPHYISQVKYNGELATITACNVAYENDAYVVTFSVFEYTNYATLNYTFTGAIEGLNAPEACDCLKEPETPEGGEGDVINVTIQNLTVGYDQPGEKEMQFWYSATNAHVIDFKGFSNCNPGQPLAAGTYSSAAYTIDDSYCIFDYGTTNGSMTDIEVVVTDNGDGTYTYDAKFTHNGQKYAFVYTGAYPM